jgi:hypothetical protein
MDAMNVNPRPVRRPIGRLVSACVAAVCLVLLSGCESMTRIDRCPATDAAAADPAGPDSALVEETGAAVSSAWAPRQFLGLSFALPIGEGHSEWQDLYLPIGPKFVWYGDAWSYRLLGDREELNIWALSVDHEEEWAPGPPLGVPGAVSASASIDVSYEWMLRVKAEIHTPRTVFNVYLIVPSGAVGQRIATQFLASLRVAW